MQTTDTREQIVNVARSYLGTPYHHQARLKGIGIDCVGLIVGVAKALGLFERDCAEYSAQPDGFTLEHELSQVCRRVASSEIVPGDLIVIWFTKPSLPQHVAIRTDYGMIHTYATVGKVVEHGYTAIWQRRTLCGYRFLGVE